MFAIPRTADRLVDWLEGVVDPEQKIARQRQLFIGEDECDCVPVERRVPGELVVVKVGNGDACLRPGPASR